MNDKVTYWVEMSDYDFETARAMLQTKRYLYVGFMCHQVIEKILKAYWSKVTEEPPLKIHSLSRLAEKTSLDQMMTEEQLEFIDFLEPLNIGTTIKEFR
jgi:HEPN domain-containing protein